VIFAGVVGMRAIIKTSFGGTIGRLELSGWNLRHSVSFLPFTHPPLHEPVPARETATTSRARLLQVFMYNATYSPLK
jgi:hypothetical protein